VIVEAEVELDTEALLQEQRRREDRRGEQAVRAATGGLPPISSPEFRARDQADECSPLLERTSDSGDGDDEDEEEEEQAWTGTADFAHLPWYGRPSIYWVIVPFFVMACAFGGIIAPKLNLILELICREYITERMAHEPGFTMAPVNFDNGNNNQCRIPEVQQRVAQFNIWGGLLSGILAAVTSPKLGALSDRYGRKPILIITSIGTVLGEIITIFAALYPETFPVPVLLLSYALDGLTGSFLVAMSISNAYATDCTPPSERNVAFGFFHASLFTGLAIGPIVAGYIVKWTGKIVIVFFIMSAVHVAFILFVAVVVPESLSKKRQMLAREKHGLLAAAKDPNRDWINSLRAFNLLEPLKILRPTGPGASRALRRNLFVLAAVDTIVFGVAMGSISVIIIYMNYQFGWGTFESGRYITIVNIARTFCLLVVLPLLTKWYRGRQGATKQKNKGSDMFDLTMIRIAILFDTLGYLGFSVSRTDVPFILSGVVASFGGIGSPTLQAALTKHVPEDRTGQLLGAMGLLHALARVIAPAVFNAIYSATVETFTQTVFVCLCATFGLAFVTSWFIRPHVYYAEKVDVANAASDVGEGSTNRRIPIVTAVAETAVAGTRAAFS